MIFFGGGMLQEFIIFSAQLSRYAIALCIVYICARCAAALFSYKTTDPVRGWLINTFNGDRLELKSSEVSIGRSQKCDLVLNYGTVSRLHAVIAYRGGSFLVFNTLSKLGVTVNGAEINKKCTLSDGDTVAFGGNPFLFKAAPVKQIKSKYGKLMKPHFTLLFILLSFCQLLMLFVLENTFAEKNIAVAAAFGGFAVLEWLYYASARVFLKISDFSLELIAFSFASIGLTIASSVYPDTVLNQFAALVIGLFGYVFLLVLLRYLEVVKLARWAAAAGAVGLLALTLIIAKPVNGALSWISLGPVSLQPSELVKAAFIFVGAATLEKLQSVRSLTKYVIFAVVCIGELFFMYDFGTALIFFFTFIVIAFMRSGDIRTLVLICAGALLGGVLIIMFKPYIAGRFSTYMHVWENMDTGGYQQTRTMIYSVSGGLFGLGIGKGALRHVFASAEDLVFGVVCEEFGCILGFLIPAVYAVLAVWAVKSSRKAYSGFYAIAGVAAAALILFQSTLNIFGVTDLLPLTGVTLPFISKGGSSIMGSFLLLAFIKSVDRRTYAPFITKGRRAE